MTRHIKTDRTVTQIDTYTARNEIGQPTRTVVTTRERQSLGVSGHMAHDQAGTLADHVAALREIGQTSMADKIEQERRAETVTFGFQTRV